MSNAALGDHRFSGDLQLESWKEIATYLKRGIRTVQRWEAKEGLPVRRQVHEKLGTVYAYARELDTWRKRRSPQVGTAPSEDILLAVLPIIDLNTKRHWFATGLTDEIITQFGRLCPERLRVIARTSVLQYASSKQPVRRIANELSVSYVLEGTVRRHGGRVRVSAKLVAARDETQLWAETYDRELTGPLAVQSYIAYQIVNSIALYFGVASSRPSMVFQDFAVREACLRGHYFCNKRNSEYLKRGVQCFQQALHLDPNYAAAYAGLAGSYTLLGFYGDIAPQEVMPKAKAAALKAIQIDNSLGEAHSALADLTSVFDWDWVRAEHEYQKAIELNPISAPGHHWYAHYLGVVGRHDEALEEIECARRLDPFSPIIGAWAGVLSYFVRRYDSAVEALGAALDLDPHLAVARAFLGLAYEQKCMFNEAIAEAKAAVELCGGGTGFLAMLAHAHAAAGHQEEAIRVLQKLKELSKRSYVPSYGLAVICAGIGQPDQAFHWLTRAYEERCAWLTLANVDPRLDSLRSDRRFKRILSLLGFGARSDFGEQHYCISGDSTRPFRYSLS